MFELPQAKLAGASNAKIGVQWKGNSCEMCLVSRIYGSELARVSRQADDIVR